MHPHDLSGNHNTPLTPLTSPSGRHAKAVESVSCCSQLSYRIADSKNHSANILLPSRGVLLAASSHVSENHFNENVRFNFNGTQQLLACTKQVGSLGDKLNIGIKETPYSWLKKETGPETTTTRQLKNLPPRNDQCMRISSDATRHDRSVPLPPVNQMQGTCASNRIGEQPVYPHEEGGTNSDDPPEMVRRPREKSVDKYLLQIEEMSQVQDKLMLVRNIRWSSLRKSDFLKLATGGKISSASLQVFIESAPVSQELISVVYKSREVLIKDKFGCHILRRMLSKSPYLFSHIKHSTLARFVEMASNECSSRVMQFIAAQDEEYREKCIQLFVSNWKRVVIHVASNYLLTACLKHTDNSSAVFRSVGSALCSKRHFLPEVKYDKRILVTYVEFCDEQQLETFFKILNFSHQFLRRCDDKYMVYIFRLLLRRGHKESEQLLYHFLSTELVSCLSTKYFKSFLSDIFAEKRHLEQVKVTVKEILLGLLVEHGGFSLVRESLLTKDGSSALAMLDGMSQNLIADGLPGCALKSLRICLNPTCRRKV